MINIISHQHPVASASNGLFVKILRVRPVSIECDFISDAHRKEASSCRSQSAAAHAKNPIAYVSSTSDARLTGGQRAVAMKWIRCEAEVAVHYIHVHPIHALTFQRD